MTQLPQPRTSTPQLHPHIAGKVRQLAPEPATRILDLGCGSGALLERLAGMGYRDLTGVDIRPPASGGSIRYRHADLDCFRLDVPDGAFDLALAELARLLHPGPSCCSRSPIASNSSTARAIPPTSRPLMRLAARLLRPIVRTPIAQGDTLCLLIQRQDASPISDPSGALKVARLTSHY